MCWADECKGCGKQTWAGCGKHIDSALKGIAEEARCDSGTGSQAAAPPS